MAGNNGVNGGPNWNANRNAMLQVIATASMAALAAYVAMKVGLSEIRTNQENLEARMNRIEAKLDRVVESRQRP